MKNSFRLLTILGIPVEVNLSWFIIFGLILYSLSVGYFPITSPDLPSPIHWLMGLIAALLLFVCLLLHELSHSYVAKMNKLPISGITLFVFGGVAHLEKEPNSPEIEFKMAIAGPAMSVFLGLFFLMLTGLFRKYTSLVAVYTITDYLSFLNFAVAIFNLIPGFPLDGGRVLRAVVWRVTGNLRQATYLASSFGRGFAYVLMGLGVLSLLSLNILSGAWLIFIGLFLYEAANSSYRQLVLKNVLSRTRAASMMTRDVITIPASITLERLVEDYFFKFRHSSFPVIEDDTILGLVTFHDVKEIDRAKWPSTPAHDAMIPISEGLLIHDDDNLFEALTKVANNGIGRVLVIHDSKLVGILSQRDIVKLFEFRNGLEKEDEEK